MHIHICEKQELNQYTCTHSSLSCSIQLAPTHRTYHKQHTQTWPALVESSQAPAQTHFFRLSGSNAFDGQGFMVLTLINIWVFLIIWYMHVFWYFSALGWHMSLQVFRFSHFTYILTEVFWFSGLLVVHMYSHAHSGFQNIMRGFSFMCSFSGFDVCMQIFWSACRLSGIHKLSCMISLIYTGFEAVRVAWLMRTVQVWVLFLSHGRVCRNCRRIIFWAALHIVRDYACILYWQPQLLHSTQ